MNVPNKLVLVHGKPFHSRQMFAGKAGALSYAIFKYSTIGYAPGFSHFTALKGFIVLAPNVSKFEHYLLLH
jgi:hypothetical protein